MATQALILPRGARSRNAKAGGAFGIVAGIVAAFLFIYPSPNNGNVAQQLANYDAGSWTIQLVANTLLLLAALPFAAYLRSVLEGKSPGTASAAVLLFVVGIVFATVAGIVQATVLGSLASSTDTNGAFLIATILYGVVTSLAPLAILEGGIVLFSVTMLNSRIFPNWVADVGIGSAVVVIAYVGLTPFSGSAGFLTFVLLIAYVVLFLAWTFASSAYLLRSARAAPAPSFAPA